MVSSGSDDILIDTRLLVGGLCSAGETAEDVAARFGVPGAAASRTLRTLAREGLLEEAGDGTFRLLAASEDDLRELYAISVLLEGLALRTCPPFDAAALMLLTDANARLRAAVGDTPGAIAADDDFHTALVVHSGNDELCRTHRQAHLALARYERYYMVDAERIERSAAGHDRIVDALRDGDHEVAVHEMRRNYDGSLPDIADGIGRG